MTIWKEFGRTLGRLTGKPEGTEKNHGNFVG
jgi:hypothetical protein